MTLVPSLLALSILVAAVLGLLGWVLPKVTRKPQTGGIPLACLATLWLGIQTGYVLYNHDPTERANAIWREDDFFFLGLLLWNVIQIGLHWLLLAQDERRSHFASWGHPLLVLCGGMVVSGMALDHYLLILPTGIALMALGLPLTVGGKKLHGPEALLKTFFDQRFALLFFSMAVVVGLSTMHTVELAWWFKSAQAGAIPALLALLLFATALFTLVGITPFHMNRVDLLTGGHPVGAMVQLIGQSFMVATLCFRLARAGELSTSSVVSDQFLAGFCLFAFILSALSAMDQRTVNRILAFLIVGNLPLLLPSLQLSSLLQEQSPLIPSWALLASLGLGCLLVYFVFLPLSQRSKELLTWESCSGIGLNNPFMAFVFLLGLANLSGFPGTLGFDARVSLAQLSFEQGWVYTGWAILLSCPLQSLVVLRLASFFFYRKRTVPVKVPTPLSLQIPSLLLFALLAGSGFVYWLI
ncbi:MAG: hypothetical protein CMH56_07260 [Myxococcales bacterium]|nr:hypothetical protein [Myxococcales bacterium]|tara:strand:+ start:928 stop:2334 length:1407 start_codon:yes stop_codon:yes gene_type:complete